MVSLREVESLVRRIARDRDRLRRMGVIRTERTIADYVEWMVARRLHLKLSENTIQEGFDAMDREGKRYQIKYRLHTKGATGFDNVHPRELDFLVCAFLDKRTYRIRSAYKVTRIVVVKHSLKFKRGLSFRWTSKIPKESGVQKVI